MANEMGFIYIYTYVYDIYIYMTYIDAYNSISIYVYIYIELLNLLLMAFWPLSLCMVNKIESEYSGILMDY